MVETWTHSEGHDEVDHALFVVALPAAQAEPLIHHAALTQAFGNSHVCPRNAVVHGKRPLKINTGQTGSIL